MAFLFRRLSASVFLAAIVFVSQAQPVVMEDPLTKVEKPYQVSTSGKRITIKSSRGIKQVMLWTTSGNRVAEHKQINNNSFVVEIPVSQKTFFLMIGLNDGKIYTEKIGLQ